MLPLPMRRRTLLGTLAAALAAPALPARASGEIRIAHAMGEAVLPGPASRVVSLGYTSHDPILALGIQPLAVRYWFGGAPGAVWPWAQPLLSGPAPEVLSGEASLEKVAALQPDLIVGIGSGISEAEYGVLSQIAPVLMQPEGDPSYGMGWDAMTRIIARATGKEAEAEALIDAVHQKFAAARARHPDWAGKTAVAAYHASGETGAFMPRDTRSRFLLDLGFALPEAIAALPSPEGFYAPLSPEDLSPIDTDLILWISSQDRAADLAALPMRALLTAHAEGREAFAGGVLAAALSFGSIVSLPYALDALESELTAALDGDPATPAPAATAAGLAP